MLIIHPSGKDRNQVTFEKLNYFYTLATCLNYTKASQLLYISQPTLSKQISQLEKELDLTLFVRTKHSVVLTKEGEECLKMVQPLLLNYEKFYNWVKETHSRNDAPSLRIGYYGILLRDVVLFLVNSLMERNPFLDISIKNFTPAKTAEALQSGTVDIAVLRDTYCRSLVDVSFEKLCTIRQFLIIPDNHPFNCRKSVSLKELEPYRFVDLYQNDSTQGHDDMLRLCRKYGLKPNIYYSCDDANSYNMMIRSGRGIGIAYAFSNSVVQGLKYVPLDCDSKDLDSDIMAVWKSSNRFFAEHNLSKVIQEIRGQMSFNGSAE